LSTADAKPAATPRPAATLVMLRRAKGGFEVMMVRRHEASSFAAGALVFPGGRVDDTDLACAPHCVAEAELLDHRIAAIRESWEEAGVLLARRRGGERIISRTELKAIQDRHDGHSPPFAELLATEELQLATDALVPFAHWITPAFRPKRFDTWFFLAPAPEDQLAVADGRETVDLVWIAPEHAVAEADAGRVDLMFVTRMNLLRLARSRTVEDALEAARRQEVVTVCPELVKRPEGKFMRIPEAAGYGGSEFPSLGLERPR
jgi:8-oxo-dGTP pyrophosphatase MutT (NUDIX family)